MARGLSVNESKLIDGVTISQYYNDNIQPLNKNFRKMVGDKPTGLCPFHDDTDPSFHDWRAKKLFRCFGCGAVGDVIRLHQHTRNKYHGEFMSREKAMESLAKMYGIELEVNEKGEIQVESPFDLARKKLVNKEQYDINPKDMSKMSIAGFRYFNNQTKNNKNLPELKKVQSYHRLDVMVAAFIMQQKAQDLSSDKKEKE